MDRSPPRSKLKRSILIALLTIVAGACSGESHLVDEDNGPANMPPVHDTTAATPDVDAGPSALPADLQWSFDSVGPYGAGYRSMEITYIPKHVDESRSLKISLWCPTEDLTGEPVAYFGLFEQEDVFVNASLAPPVDPDRGYPVHVHSHGHASFAGASPSLMRYFATHGWVVAAPDHTGNTLADHDVPRPTAMYFLRSLDITETLNVLESLPDDDPLANQMNTASVLMSGHSFGGYTTYATAGASFDMANLQAKCAVDNGPGGSCTDVELAVFADGLRDARVHAVIPMAAGNRDMFGDEGYDTIEIPILTMSGSDDDQVSNEGQSDPIWELLEGEDALRVNVVGGCHQLFGLGECFNISNEEGFRIVNTYAMAFARFHILADPGAETLNLLSGTTTLSYKVIFEAKTTSSTAP